MPDYTLSFQEAALEDVELIVVWYEKQAFGLSKRFEKELSNCLARIVRYPENHPFHSTVNSIRKVRLNLFPYQVYYALDSYTILVFAVIHTSRSDRFIKKRLS